MSDKNDLKGRLVPAVCTQCGATLEVDPTQDAAVCKYCNTPFIVQKAVENYTVQQAKIEHVDTVKLDMKGTADSFFSFVGEQMSESRKIRAEERRERRALDREITRLFLKIFGFIMIGMVLFGMVMIVIDMIRGDSGEETDSTGANESTTACYILPGTGSGQPASLEAFDFDGDTALHV